jgi:Domain of unknown function (DUF4399)
MKSAIAAALFAFVLPTVAQAEQQATPSPAGAKVFIIEPKASAVVSSPVTVKFGIEGMEVAPAGSDTPNSGHHHLIIDTVFDNTGDAIPADDNHKHFGKGQTETTVELKPGVHSLQLVLGDKNHIPHVPPVMSELVSITVK